MITGAVLLTVGALCLLFACLALRATARREWELAIRRFRLVVGAALTESFVAITVLVAHGPTGLALAFGLLGLAAPLFVAAVGAAYLRRADEAAQSSAHDRRIGG